MVRVRGRDGFAAMVGRAPTSWIAVLGSFGKASPSVAIAAHAVEGLDQRVTTLRSTCHRIATEKSATASRNAFTSAAKSLWCWKRNPCAESG